MASAKGSQNLRSLMYPGKSALLPPKIPCPSVSTSSTEYVPSGLTGSKTVQKPREGTGEHQRASSESFILDEQPFWLDDLLNEPESPIRRNGHRRSSSDSFAYLDAANAVDLDYSIRNEYGFVNTVSLTPRGIQDKDARATPFYSGASLISQQNRPWDPFVAIGAQPSYLPSARETLARHNSGPAYMSIEAAKLSSLTGDTKNLSDCVSQNQTNLFHEKRESSGAMSDTDSSKHAKQQFAQRSRVRKLQYIAELERSSQTLEAEAFEVSAELKFLNQQNLVLGMENKALTQRLESLAQEKLIKHLEQEILEREIGRLQALHKQQQQQQRKREEQQQQTQKSSSTHRRASSKDLESRFANLCMKNKDSSSSHIPTTGCI